MMWIRCGSLLMAVGVALGAFGAHGLSGRLPAESLTVYHTAVLYHLIHALGLIAIGAVGLARPFARVDAAGWWLLIGIVLFSGSLYALSLTGIRKLGMITPLGGLALLIGWLCVLRS